MKSTGIVRKIDKLGRIVIPSEIRSELDISDSSSLEIFIDGKHVLLKKCEDSCIFCDSNENLISYKEKLICPTCLNGLKD